jgi:hypothetical protein
MLAGSSCGGLMTVLGNPLDCLRVRWQVHVPSKGDSIWAFGRDIVRNEGLVNGLWKPGVATNASAIALSAAVGYGFYPVIRDQVCNGCEFIADDTLATLISIFETMQIDLHLRHEGMDREKHETAMLLSGFLVGGASYWVVTPLFQMKTRLQAQLTLYNHGAGSGSTTLKYRNGLQGLAYIYKSEGPLQLFRGAVPMAIRGSFFRCGAFFGEFGSLCS